MQYSIPDLYNQSQMESFISKNQPIDFAFLLAEGYKDHPNTLYDGHGASQVREQLKKDNISSSHARVESMEICRK